MLNKSQHSFYLKKKLATNEGERLLLTWGSWPFSCKPHLRTEVPLRLLHSFTTCDAGVLGLSPRSALGSQRQQEAMLLNELCPQTPWVLNCPHALFLGPSLDDALHSFNCSASWGCLQIWSLDDSLLSQAHHPNIINPAPVRLSQGSFICILDNTR